MYVYVIRLKKCFSHILLFFFRTKIIHCNGTDRGGPDRGTLQFSEGEEYEISRGQNLEHIYAGGWKKNYFEINIHVHLYVNYK